MKPLSLSSGFAALVLATACNNPAPAAPVAAALPAAGSEASRQIADALARPTAAEAARTLPQQEIRFAALHRDGRVERWTVKAPSLENVTIWSYRIYGPASDGGRVMSVGVVPGYGSPVKSRGFVVRYPISSPGARPIGQLTEGALHDVLPNEPEDRLNPDGADCYRDAGGGVDRLAPTATVVKVGARRFVAADKDPPCDPGDTRCEPSPRWYSASFSFKRACAPAPKASPDCAIVWWTWVCEPDRDVIALGALRTFKGKKIPEVFVDEDYIRACERREESAAPGNVEQRDLHASNLCLDRVNTELGVE